MRAGRVLLPALAGLVLLGGIGAALLPGALDWNRFRPEIERLASIALNHPVRIGGAISLSLLPEPTLTAGDLQIEDAGDGIALGARELRLRVALWPLLAGRLNARSMVLQEPSLRLPWPLPPGALQSRPAWLRSARAEIRDGAVQLGGLVLTGVNAQLATEPSTGTLSGSGVAGLGGRTWRFTVRIAQPGRDGAAGFDASLDGEGPLQDTGGRFSGALAPDGTLAGSVSGRGRDLALLVPAPPQPWQGSGSLSAAGGLLVADDLTLELGGSPARGVVALRVGEGARLDLALAASRLDLDGWLSALAGKPATALPTGVDLSAEAATLAGGTLRRLRAGFDLAGGVTAVRDASAILPGDATLALSGKAWRPTEPGPGAGLSFRGSGRLAAPDLWATLRWAGALMPGVVGLLPGEVLREADVTGSVAVTPGQVALSDLRGTLDGARVEGSVGLVLGPGPLLSARLVLDALALDPWLTRPDALAGSYPWPGLADRFARVAADVTVHARSATWAGVALDAFDLAGRFDQHGAQLRRLAAEGRGVQLALSGTLSEGRVAEGKLDLAAKDASALRELLPPGWDGRRVLRGPAELHLRAAGPPAALSVQASAALGDLRIEAQPLLDVPAGAWAGPLSVQHPGARRLLAQLNLPGAWLGEGSLSLVARTAATPDRLALHDIVLTAGALRLGGGLDVRRRGGPVRVTGNVEADALPLPVLAARSSDPLPLGLLQGWEAAVQLRAKEVLAGQRSVLSGAAADVSLQEGTLRLDAVKAGAAGGALEGSAVLEAGVVPPRLTATGRATRIQLAAPVFGTPLDVLAGTGDVRVNLAARGYSPAALLSTLSGDAAAALRDGAVTGFDLTGAGAALAGEAPRREGSLRAALLGGTTAFGTLDLAAGLRDGVATLTAARLTGPGGAATASGSADLAGGSLDLHLVLRPAEPQGAPEIAVSLSGAAGGRGGGADTPPPPPGRLAQPGALRVLGERDEPVREHERADLSRSGLVHLWSS